MNRYDGKVALVSGAMGGLGMAIATRLASEGARVVLGDVAVSNRPLPEPLRERGYEMILDVANPASWTRATEEIISRFGSLDLLVNNAGVTSPDRTPIDQVSPEEWRRIQSINVDGTFFGIQAALRVMKDAPRGGAIVNICSISSFTSIENHEAYSTSKSAVRGLTRHAALTAAKLGYQVRINAVHPGTIWTPLLSSKWTARYGSEEKAKAYLRSLTPSEQVVEPVDIASAVAFLGSDDARMITGSELVVDAGATLQ